MYFKSQKKIINHLFFLKKTYSLIGLKAEFEAEGSTHDEIFLLRSLTNLCGVKLFVKIGGVEAINDIKFLIYVGVDGIIAPMVESKFSLYKFLSYFNDVPAIRKKMDLTINIESKNGLQNISEIVSLSKNFIDHVTVGRTDLANSYFDQKIHPNSDFILKKIIEISKVFKKNKINVGIGGSIDKHTISMYGKNKFILNNVYKIETRKVILPTKKFLLNKKALDDALKFEELYILMKNEINEFFMNSDLARLSILRTRK